MNPDAKPDLQALIDAVTTRVKSGDFLHPDVRFAAGAPTYNQWGKLLTGAAALSVYGIPDTLILQAVYDTLGMTNEVRIALHS